MKTFGFTLIVLGLALAATPVSLAQEQTAFTLETHTEGSGGYFTLAGSTERNPVLNVPANAQITVTLVGTDAGVHNIQVGDQEASEYVTAEGETVEYTFTSPASGTVQYFCVPHKAAGMAGTVAVAGATVTPANGDQNESPGVQVLGVGLAMLGAALVLGRRN